MALRLPVPTSRCAPAPAHRLLPCPTLLCLLRWPPRWWGGAGKRLPGKENGLTSSAFSAKDDLAPGGPGGHAPHRRTESRGYDRYGGAREESNYGREAVTAW